MTAREAIGYYFQHVLRWERGRQESGYDKMLLLLCPFPVPFDWYLLRFPTGAEIPPHVDPVTDKRHFRLNIVLKKARAGGEFICQNPIWNLPRIKLFRPDLSEHSVTRVTAGSRLVFSVGWVRRK